MSRLTRFTSSSSEQDRTFNMTSIDVFAAWHRSTRVGVPDCCGHQLSALLQATHSALPPMSDQVSGGFDGSSPDTNTCIVPRSDACIYRSKYGSHLPPKDGSPPRPRRPPHHRRSAAMAVLCKTKGGLSNPNSGENVDTQYLAADYLATRIFVVVLSRLWKECEGAHRTRCAPGGPSDN